MAKSAITDTDAVTSSDVAAVADVFGELTEMSKTDIAAAKSAGVSLEVYADMHPVLKLIITDETYLEGNDQFSFAAQLLTTESLDDLMNGESSEDVLHGEDHEGQPFMLYGVRYRPGDKNVDIPVFAIFDVSFNGEDRQLMSTSAFNAMVKAKILKERGAFPRFVVLKQKADKTRSGYFPVDMVDATEADIAAAEKAAKEREAF